MIAASVQSVTARAPGKVILFGEHAINRGQPALATAVGLYATCRISEADAFEFVSRTQTQRATKADLLALRHEVESWRQSENFEAIRQLARRDYFAPQKYILASALGDDLPDGLRLEWSSDVPSSSGLGSGGSAFTAMCAALAEGGRRKAEGGTSCSSSVAVEVTRLKLAESRSLLTSPATEIPLERRAAWAHLGDIIAHGGIASALDTQTSLLGGVIRFMGKGLADRVNCAPGLHLVIAHTGISAATSEVNTRVRLWLAADPEARMKFFQSIGLLSRAALPALERGDWEELGRLMSLNQLVLERIGVSCSEIERLVNVAIRAGAYGAKLSGSGGGGIVIALTSAYAKARVAEALSRAGGQVFTPEVAVPGVQLLANDIT